MGNYRTLSGDGHPFQGSCRPPRHHTGPPGRSAEAGVGSEEVGYPRSVAGRETESVVVPTGRHGLPADIVAEHQRERILVATIAVIGERGYRAATVDHIVKAAKVGYVAFYELFEGKEDCFLAALGRIVADTRAELAERISTELPWSEQISAGLRVIVELIVAEPERARLVLVEAQGAGRGAYRRYEVAMDEAVPELSAGRALRPKGAPALSAATEEATLTGVAWILQQMLAEGDSAKPRETLAAVTRVALAPYLGESEAAKIAAAAAKT
jgi:AcrR family transcriptional regulator